LPLNKSAWFSGLLGIPSSALGPASSLSNS
jgi:hypothetical protein